MSRGYVEGDSDNPYQYLAHSVLERAIAGKRGQAFLRELAQAMDAMPEKRLVAHSFDGGTGDVCTLGCLGRARHIDMTELELLARKISIDYDEAEVVEYIGLLNDAAAEAFGVARTLVADLMWHNDDGDARDWRNPETPEDRWKRMRALVARWLHREVS